MPSTVHLWTPPSYGTPSLRVRRNPNASVYEAYPEADGQDVLLSPNGHNMLEGAAEDALAQLQAAGPRGAALLGAAAGFVFSGWKAGVLGGVLGYFGGHYLTNIVSKTLTAATAVAAVTTATTKVTP
jgi:hypothetical protein